MKNLLILFALLFSINVYSQNKHIRIEIPVSSGGGGTGTDTIQYFTHIGTVDLLSTLSRNNAGSIKIVPGTQIEVLPTINGINGIAKIRTNFNGCANCVGYFGVNNGFVNDSVQSDLPFFYQYEEGFGTLSVPQLNLTATNSYNNTVALYIERGDAPGFSRVYVSGTDVSGFNSTSFFHKVSTPSSITLPSGLNGSAAHFILNDGVQLILNRSGAETINGKISDTITSSEKLVVLVNDGSGKWYRSILGSSGSGGGVTDLTYTGSSSPITLNSSTGSDVTIIQGTGISLSATGSALTITNTVVNTDAQGLSFSGASSPISLLISGGTGVTFTQGSGVTLTQSGGNNITIASSTSITNLGTSGSSSNISLSSSTGTGISLIGGTNITFSAIGSNTFTINSASGGLGGSGVINQLPIWTASSTLGNSNIVQNASNDWTFGTTGNNTIHLGNVVSTTNRIYFGDFTNTYIGEEISDDRITLAGTVVGIKIAGSFGSSGNVLKSTGAGTSWSNDNDNQILGWSAITSSLATLAVSNGNSINITTGSGITFSNVSGNLQIASSASGGTVTGMSTSGSLITSLLGGSGTIQWAVGSGITITNTGTSNAANLVFANTGALGNGTINFHPKWSSSNTLTNSLIQDNGTEIGIGVAPVSSVMMQFPSGDIRIGSAVATTNRILFGDGTLGSSPVWIGESGADDRLVLRSGGGGLQILVAGGTGTNGQVLTSNGTTDTWQTLPSSPLTNLTWSSISATTAIIGNSNGSGITITAGTNMSFANVSGNLQLISNAGGGGSGTVTGISTTSNVLTPVSGSGSLTFVGSGGTTINTTNAGANATITISSATSNGTVTSVGLSGTTGINVSNSPITTSGTLALSLSNDLLGLENFTSETGIAIRSAANTWITRSVISGNGIIVNNGDGISGNISITASDINNTNELQSLTLTGMNVTISSGGATPNSITLPSTNLSNAQSSSNVVITPTTGGVAGTPLTIVPSTGISITSNSATQFTITNTSPGVVYTAGNGISITGGTTINAVPVLTFNTGTNTLGINGSNSVVLNSWVSSVGLNGTTGISVSGSPITGASSFTLSLSNDLLALENFTSQTGIAVRTATDTWAMRTITGSSGISVTDPVSGNITVSVSSITESQVTNLVTDLAAKQGTISLTTTGSSGAATLVGSTLNIPNYNQTYSHSGTTSYTNTLSNSGGSFSLNGSSSASGSNGITVSNSGGAVTLNVADVSATNELQSVAVSNNLGTMTIALSPSPSSGSGNYTLNVNGGGYLTLSNVGNAITLNFTDLGDASNNNEAQTLSATSNQLRLSVTGSGFGGGIVNLVASGIATITGTGDQITVGATKTDLSSSQSGSNILLTPSNSGNAVTLTAGNGISLTNNSSTNFTINNSDVTSVTTVSSNTTLSSSTRYVRITAGSTITMPDCTGQLPRVVYFYKGSSFSVDLHRPDGSDMTGGFFGTGTLTAAVYCTCNSTNEMGAVLGL
jgi:trimeric autotransporter adhesin